MSNEITAHFKGRIGVCESVYQYDYGMVLVIDGIDLQDPFEAHFTHAGDDESITFIGAKSGESYRVAIPNECLALPGEVTVYIYNHTCADDGQTEYVVRFRVIGRARPVDNATEEQESAISQAIALLVSTNATIYEKMQSYFDDQIASTITSVTNAWLAAHPEVYNTQAEVDGETMVIAYAGDIRAYLYEHPEFLTTQTAVEDETVVLAYTGALDAIENTSEETE